MKRQRIGEISEISAETLRKFAETRRLANRAVQKAIAENKKYGIKPSYQFSK